MLNDTIGSLAVFQEYILFSMAVLIIFAASGSLIRINSWKSPVLKIYGIFTGMGTLKLVTLALVLVRLLFYISALLFSTQPQMPHIIFVALVTIALNFLLADIYYALFDFMYVAVIFGELFIVNLLHSYLSDIQMKGVFIAAYVIIIVFTLFTILCSASQAVASLAGRRRGYREKLDFKKMGYQALVMAAGIFVILVPYYFINRLDTLYINKNLYQYTADGRVEFKGTSKISRTGQGSLLENGDKLYELKPVPLYYKDQERILIPNVVSIIQPSLSLTNRLENMTEIYMEDSRYYISNDGREERVSDFFLFDGKDTYVFFEPITIKWLNNSIDLSPFSYVTVKYNRSIEVFNRSTGGNSLIDTGISNVTAKMRSKATINMSTDILIREDGQEQMLFIQPNLLKDLI